MNQLIPNLQKKLTESSTQWDRAQGAPWASSAEIKARAQAVSDGQNANSHWQEGAGVCTRNGALHSTADAHNTQLSSRKAAHGILCVFQIGQKAKINSLKSGREPSSQPAPMPELPAGNPAVPQRAANTLKSSSVVL